MVSASTPNDAIQDFLLLLPPEVLEIILFKLSARDLFQLANSCHGLQKLASNEKLWKLHIRSKWGRLTPYENKVFLEKLNVSSARLLYSLMEQGKICIPVHIFNCEHNVGCLLSAYSARVRHVPSKNVFSVEYIERDYDHSFETSIAKTEQLVELTRLKPVFSDADPHSFHKSCDLIHANVGEHVEVQWRFHQDMPFIWWFGIISHLPRCKKMYSENLERAVPNDDNDNDCVCSTNNYVRIKFRQFGVGHVWRVILMERKRNVEERFNHGGLIGHVGGVRVIKDAAQVSDWLKFGSLEPSLLH